MNKTVVGCLPRLSVQGEYRNFRGPKLFCDYNDYVPIRAVYKVGNKLTLFNEDLYSSENLAGKQCANVIIVVH